jgi:hypothetical protein
MGDESMFASYVKSPGNVADLGADGSVVIFECDVCEVSFKSHKRLENHFASQGHLKEVSKLAKKSAKQAKQNVEARFGVKQKKVKKVTISSDLEAEEDLSGPSDSDASDNSDDDDEDDEEAQLAKEMEELSLKKKQLSEKKAKKKAVKNVFAGWEHVETYTSTTAGLPPREVDETGSSGFTCPFGCRSGTAGTSVRSFKSMNTYIHHLIQEHPDGDYRLSIDTPPNAVRGTVGTRHVFHKLKKDVAK